MTYNFNGKNIRIPDSEITNSMNILELTKEEAIQLWLEDNDYLQNAEQEALNEKAKAVKVSNIIQAKDISKAKTQKERVRKEDPTKENLISALAEALPALCGATNIKIENIGKVVTFTIGEDNYKFDLTRTRKPKA